MSQRESDQARQGDPSPLELELAGQLPLALPRQKICRDCGWPFSGDGGGLGRCRECDKYQPFTREDGPEADFFAALEDMR